MNTTALPAVAVLVASGPSDLPSAVRAEEPIPPNTFVQVAKDEIGGHYYSQVIHAPTAKAMVSWGRGPTTGPSGRTRPSTSSPTGTSG